MISKTGRASLYRKDIPVAKKKRKRAGRPEEYVKDNRGRPVVGLSEDASSGQHYNTHWREETGKKKYFGTDRAKAIERFRRWRDTIEGRVVNVSAEDVKGKHKIIGEPTRYGREAQLETFLMSNICPQKPNLNRQIWKNLESLIANKYAQEFEEIWIITGPIFDENIERLKSGVEIPDSFYKIIIDEKDNRPRMLALIIPQNVKSNEPLEKYLVSIDEIEKLTQLDFMSEMEDELENKIEAEKGYMVE